MHNTTCHNTCGARTTFCGSADCGRRRFAAEPSAAASASPSAPPTPSATVCRCCVRARDAQRAAAPGFADSTAFGAGEASRADGVRGRCHAAKAAEGVRLAPTLSDGSRRRSTRSAGSATSALVGTSAGAAVRAAESENERGWRGSADFGRRAAKRADAASGLGITASGSAASESTSDLAGMTAGGRDESECGTFSFAVVAAASVAAGKDLRFSTATRLTLAAPCKNRHGGELYTPR